MQFGDTIAAVSSAVGAGSRMIVRLSGPEARAIASCVAPAAAVEAGAASRAVLRFGAIEVPGWVYLFLCPRSYSGEDVVEFHLPGNPLLARWLLDELTRHGARHAGPGEFTARAYFNGRLDLAEAEGVAATISAHSQRELRAARQLLAGELARRLRPMLELLADSLALVEVGIDFSEEDIALLAPAALRDRILRVDEALETLLAESGRFESLAHEPQIALIGRPNAGKSTLLNALSGDERAVVSPEAGTTRDVIWSHVRLRRGRVRMVDVAGIAPGDDGAADAPAGPALPAAPGSGDDSPLREIDRQMRRRALSAAGSADVVVLVRDCTDTRAPLVLETEPDLTVLSKIDLLDQPPAAGPRCQPVSARSGINLEPLRDRLDALAFGGAAPGAAAEGEKLALNARHVEAIGDARQALARALELHHSAGAEIIALELREALDALGRILGSVTPDDVLGRIFSAFCIGK